MKDWERNGDMHAAKKGNGDMLKGPKGNEDMLSKGRLKCATYRRLRFFGLIDRY